MKEKIKERLYTHLDAIVKQVGDPNKIFGVFLYGSQNYGLATEESDVDTKAIYVPSFQEIMFNRPVSKIIELENGEKCELKDIREMFRNIEKQNINFVEILFTEYKVINPLYQVEYNNLVAKREDIARYDVAAGIRSMSHQALHTLRQGPEDGKKVANVLRLLYFIQQYIAGTPYKECIYPTPEMREFLLNVKQGNMESSAVAALGMFAKESLEKYTEFDKEKTKEENEQMAHISAYLKGISISAVKRLM